MEVEETDIYGIIVSGADYYGEYIVQGNIASSIMAPLEDIVHIINTRNSISSDRDFCIIKKDEILESANVEYTNDSTPKTGRNDPCICGSGKNSKLTN